MVEAEDHLVGGGDLVGAAGEGSGVPVGAVVAVQGHCAQHGVVEGELELVGDLGVAGELEHSLQVVDPSDGDAGLAHGAGGLGVLDVLLEGHVVPELAPGVFAAADAGAQDFAVTDAGVVALKDLHRLWKVIGLQAEFAQPLETAGHLVSLAGAKLGGRPAIQHGLEDVVALVAASLRQILCKVQILLVTGETVDPDHGAQHGASGKAAVPAHFCGGTDAGPHLGHDVVQHPAAGINHLGILVDVLAITGQAHEDIFAPPHVPEAGLVLRGHGADAAIGILGGDDVVDTILDELRQFLVAGGVCHEDGAANQLAPEFAAPGIGLLAVAEDIHKTLPVGALDEVFTAQRGHLAKLALQGDSTGGKNLESIGKRHKNRRRYGFCVRIRKMPLTYRFPDFLKGDRTLPEDNRFVFQE